MTTNSKNILIVGGLLFAAAAVLTYRKVSVTAYSFDNLDITPVWIDNIKPGLTQSSFSLDVMLKNLSEEPFEVSGLGIATLKRIEVILNNQVVGVANVQMEEISIPAFGNQVIYNIPVTVSTAAIVNNSSNIKKLLASINLIGYVEALGSEYQIGA